MFPPILLGHNTAVIYPRPVPFSTQQQIRSQRPSGESHKIRPLRYLRYARNLTATRAAQKTRTPCLESQWSSYTLRRWAPRFLVRFPVPAEVGRRRRGRARAREYRVEGRHHRERAAAQITRGHRRNRVPTATSTRKCEPSAVSFPVTTVVYRPHGLPRA